jgi:ATP-dependent Clp protease ATP-binding subunit ClpC
MFERFTEKTRHAIHVAREETRVFGSMAIETHHLLLGVSREDPDLCRRYLGSPDAVEEIRKRFQAQFPSTRMQPTSGDLPLSHPSKRAIAYAAEEAERLKHKIDTGHLLLGLLREDESAAAETLHNYGLKLERVREDVASQEELRRIDGHRWEPPPSRP